MSLLDTDDTARCAELNSKGLEVLRNLDSRCFGFLGFRKSGKGREGGSSQHVHEPDFVSQDFIRVGIRKLSRELSRVPQSPTVHADLLCRLGHLHLLLEDYKQALSSYQQYYSLFPMESSCDVNFLYGVGLVYFHNNSFSWAVEAFQSVLRLCPSFARATEVYLRMAVIYKKRGEYRKSVEHFKRALCMSGPSSFSKLEIQFHIGHLYFLQGSNIAAKRVFETILSSKSVPNSIKGLALKQLGWMYHTIREVGQTTPDPHAKATELLTLAVGADPSSSQAWYFLGRCHAHQGSVRDAFLAYQYAIGNTEEGQADIWCSIGLLYHKMMQPKDSLQSYLCAVYLDSRSLASWTNMGCLYEAMAQPVDALLSYKNAAVVVRNSRKIPVKCSEHISTRVSTLEQYLYILGPSVHHQRRALPSLQEAWTTLIPSNIKEKHSQPPSPILHLPTPPPNRPAPPQFSSFGAFPPSPNTPHGPPQMPSHFPPHMSPQFPLRPLGPPTKRAKTHKSQDPIIIRNISEGWSRQGIMSPPFTPSLTTPLGPHPSSAEMGLSHVSPGVGHGEMFESPPGMGHSMEGFVGLPDYRSVPSFDSVGRGEFNCGYGSNPILPPHSALLSKPPSSGPPPSWIGSSTSSNQQQPAGFPHFQLGVPGQRNETSPQGFAPMNRPFNLNLSHSSSECDPNTPAGSSSLPASSPASFPSLPSELLTASTPSTEASLLLAASPMPWDSPTPSNSPMRWVSPVPTATLASIGPNTTPSKSLVSPKVAASSATSQAVPADPTSPASSICTALSPHSLPFSLPSESPFSPLIGAGGMDSNFSTSFSPHSLPNPLYASNHGSLCSSSSSADHHSAVHPLSVGAEIQVCGEECSAGDLSDPHTITTVDQFPARFLASDSDVSPGDGAGLMEEISEMSELSDHPVYISQSSSLAGKVLSHSLSQELSQDSSPETGPSDRAGPSQTEGDSASQALSGNSTAVQSLDTGSQVKKTPTKHTRSKDRAQSVTSTPSVGAEPTRETCKKQSKAAKKKLSRLPMGEGQLLSCEEPGELMTIFQDHEVPFMREEISDSGLSSMGNKPSICGSENSSPCETISPHLVSAEILSGSSQGRFNYPETSDGSQVKPALLDPIPVPFPSLASDVEYMIHDPQLAPPHPPKPTPSMDLHPEVEVYQVKDDTDANSFDLHEFCTDPERPICMIRGLCQEVGFDIDAFSSDSLVKTCPDHGIEVRDQIQQGADENFDPSGRKQVWKCESSRSSTTIEEYAEYQKMVLLGEDYSDSSDSAASEHPDAATTKPVPNRHKKKIRFGTNVDLSDHTKWSSQLSQLDKLPKFLRVCSHDSDFLPHIGHTILGMNSVQLYMKVGGARTPGHQENNNFCSVNLNIGPGDCEWFATPNRYWGVFHKLCEKYKICFLTGSWWPILNELKELKVPVFRFTQYRGDMVWLNPGTVHWVQANNVCNNIAWNVGPLTAHQFRMAWERYQWNKRQKVRSIVPMVHMSWNLVQNVKIVDKYLFIQLQSLLKGSAKQCEHLLDHLKNNRVSVHWHGREAGEAAPSCHNCQDEVFNILFVLQHRDEYLVYCHRCAASMKKSFTVLQQYKTAELEAILASFQMCSPQQPTSA